MDALRDHETFCSRQGLTWDTTAGCGATQPTELLLQHTDRTMGEISFEVGYEDAANFGRSCRRWFGMSPGAWRESLRCKH